MNCRLFRAFDTQTITFASSKTGRAQIYFYLDESVILENTNNIIESERVGTTLSRLSFTPIG